MSTDLETRVEQMVDAYVAANPTAGMTPFAHKLKVFGQIADISSRLLLKYEVSARDEKKPEPTPLPQH